MKTLVAILIVLIANVKCTIPFVVVIQWGYTNSMASIFFWFLQNLKTNQWQKMIICIRSRPEILYRSYSLTFKYDRYEHMLCPTETQSESAHFDKIIRLCTITTCKKTHDVDKVSRSRHGLRPAQDATLISSYQLKILVLIKWRPEAVRVPVDGEGVLLLDAGLPGYVWPWFLQKEKRRTGHLKDLSKSIECL